MKRYSIKRMLAVSLTGVMIVTAVPTVAYAEDSQQSAVESQETTTEESVQEQQTVEPETQEEQAEEQQEIQTEEENIPQTETENVAEEVSLSQKFEVQPGNEEAKNEEGKARFVSGTDPESIILKESTGAGWNITALGELRPEQFVLDDAFANMVVKGVSVEPREEDNQVSDTIVLETEYAVNAGGVDEQNKYVMDKYPTGKLTVAAGVFGQDEEITSEIQVETPSITLKDLKADGEAVETVPADAKSITGTLVINGKLKDYAYLFSPDSQAEDGKRKNEVAILNVGGGLTASTISAGKVSGDYHNELAFEVELKDVSEDTGLITIPQDENVFHTALTVSIPLEVKAKVNEDVKSEEDNKENIKDTQNAEETKDAKEEVAKTDKVQAESDVENTDDNKTDEAVKDGKKITKYTIENVNGILTSLKDSIPGKLVAQTKSVILAVQGAIDGTKEPQVELNTGRTTYYGGEAVNKLPLKLSGPVTFKKDKIAKLTEKNYGDYFILGDGFSDLKITDIDLSSESDTELTLIVKGNVKSDNGYYKDATVKVNTPVLNGQDDLLIAEVAVDELKVSVKNLEADGDEAESINSDTKNIAGTIEIEKVEGIDTYFKETEAFTKQPISLELGGAFSGAKSKVTIDSKDNNKLNFKITVAQRPMTEDYGTITNSELAVPDLKINKVELVNSKAITIEKTDSGLQYTIDVDVNGGIFKDELTADDLKFTAPFNNQTEDMDIRMKKNDKGEMNGFAVVITLNPDNMGNNATGTMTLGMDKVYYPDGEHTYGLPLSLNIQDNYVKTKENTEYGEEVDTGTVVGDLLTNVFIYTIGSAIAESNPITSGIINVGVGALSSFLSGNYTTEKESDRDVLMREMQENLNTTLQRIDAATQETKDYMSFKSAQEAQDNVNELANKMKDIYSTDINFVNATKTIMEMNSGELEAEDAEYVDEILQNVYSSEAATNKSGIVNQTYKDNLIQLGRKLLDTRKDDSGNARSAFNNYEYICQNVYGLNCEGFDNRKTTNEDLLTVYEYGYKIMVTAVCYDIQKHKAFGTELDKKIKEQDELLADSSLNINKKEIIRKNKKTYTNLRKNVQSAVTVSENVLKQLETQNTAIQNAYNSSKAQLDNEVAAFNSKKRIAKCYWTNKDISLNATIVDMNENIKDMDTQLYGYLWNSLKNSGRAAVSLTMEANSLLKDNKKIFNTYLIDKSGFSNEWKLNTCLAVEDLKNSSSPFYGSITEEDGKKMKKKLEEKKNGETLTSFLERYLYVNGEPISDALKKQSQYSIQGIYLGGWQESNVIYRTIFSSVDGISFQRHVKVIDESGNITEKFGNGMEFDVWHDAVFIWGGTPKAMIISFSYSEDTSTYTRIDSSTIVPQGVICIKNAY